jgi:hypothetical protein
MEKDCKSIGIKKQLLGSSQKLAYLKVKEKEVGKG